jgi:hypothetical protein
MLDGIDLRGRTNIVALGISTDRVKIPLGLWEGSTENAALATALVDAHVFTVKRAKRAIKHQIREVYGLQSILMFCGRRSRHRVRCDLLFQDLEGEYWCGGSSAIWYSTVSPEDPFKRRLRRLSVLLEVVRAAVAWRGHACSPTGATERISVFGRHHLCL